MLARAFVEVNCPVPSRNLGLVLIVVDVFKSVVVSVACDHELVVKGLEADQDLKCDVGSDCEVDSGSAKEHDHVADLKDHAKDKQNDSQAKGDAVLVKLVRMVVDILHDVHGVGVLVIDVQVHGDCGGKLCEEQLEDGLSLGHEVVAVVCKDRSNQAVSEYALEDQAQHRGVQELSLFFLGDLELPPVVFEETQHRERD